NNSFVVLLPNNNHTSTALYSTELSEDIEDSLSSSFCIFLDDLIRNFRIDI
ncbi:13221_t:CDS:1, partial [Funneliformis mosseae]